MKISSLSVFALMLAGSGGVHAATLGATAETAAYSIKQIQSADASAVDGVYWIDPDGAGGADAFQAYGDLTSAGGGWTLGLVSRENDKAASADIIANTGTVGANSTHTRDLTELAIDQNAEIRHVITENSQVVFDGYYTGNYHGTFAADASVWTVAVGDANIFSYHFGMAWSTVDNDQDNWPSNCAERFGAWYHNACWATNPASTGTTGAGFTGPRLSSSFGYVDQWSIFVRESTTPAVADVNAQVPLPASALLLLAGVGVLGGAGRLRAKRTG